MLQTFPARTEGSVKKHWYKDMHYAEFAEDEVRVSPLALGIVLRADSFSENRAVFRHQGIREQQVEGDRAEGRQASEGLRAVCEGEFSR
jgi:hypothetical protein